MSSSLRSRRAPVRAADDESFFLELELDLETLDEAEYLVREEGMVADADLIWAKGDGKRAAFACWVSCCSRARFRFVDVDDAVVLIRSEAAVFSYALLGRWV